MNAGTVTLRFVLFFAIWTGLMLALAAWQRRRDAGLASTTALKRITGPGILVYGITVTFAIFDWAMSVEPRWYSTIFGLSFIAGQGLERWHSRRWY